MFFTLFLFFNFLIQNNHIMSRKNIFLIFVSLLIPFMCLAEKTYQVKSPNGNLVVILWLDSNGKPFYKINFTNKPIIESSKLGIQMNDIDFTRGLTIEKIDGPQLVTDSYQLLTGKRLNCVYKANQLRVSLKNNKNNTFLIVFQVSDNGVAFRYEFPDKSNNKKRIEREITSFNFPIDSRAWLHPHADAHTGWSNTQPSYEENYWMDIPVGTRAPQKAGWSFPALFNTNGNWILLTESNVKRNYCGSRLSADSPDGEYTITFPQELERTDSLAAVFPESTLPWYSPWRVIIISNNLGDIVESTLVTDLAEPATAIDWSWVKPGHASWSWVLLKDDSTIYSVQKRFIDYAAQMKWRYCLIDAYWDKQIGYEGIQRLVEYAREKNVGIILWYNSAGDWNTAPLTPRNLMFDKAIRNIEFEKISRMGVVGVKVDFWGGDGQSMMEYYHDLIEDAAKYKLMVNCHGTTIPRGWNRTYPNLVTMEAVKGFEFVTFEQANADQQPSHCTILPFTRNVVGPMDFTPMCFSEVPNIKRLTSNAFELALSVLFQSGIQHFAEIPEGMAKQPEYIRQFLSNLPEFWEDIKFIDGYPGSFVVLARKGNQKWYVAGINGKNEIRELTVDMSKLAKSNHIQIITDGIDNRSFNQYFEKQPKFTIQLKPFGGFVAVVQ